MVKNYVKKSAIPHSKENSPTKKKNKEYLNFSITIRTGRGIDLGLNATQWEEFLDGGENSRPLEYVINIEKAGIAAHFQAGIRVAQPTRLDVIQRRLKKVFADRERDPKWTDLNDQWAIKVKGHPNWEGLVGYCTKEVDFMDGQEPYKYKLDKYGIIEPWKCAYFNNTDDGSNWVYTPGENPFSYYNNRWQEICYADRINCLVN